MQTDFASFEAKNKEEQILARQLRTGYYRIIFNRGKNMEEKTSSFANTQRKGAASQDAWD